MRRSERMRGGPAALAPAMLLMPALLALAMLAGVASAGPAAAQSMEGTPQGRYHEARPPRGAPPGRLGFGADNNAQPGGVPGNAPFNNQLRKFTDPLGANGSR